MYSINNFSKYLKESKDALEDKVVQYYSFIYKNDLLNVIYEVKKTTDKPILKVLHIGAPPQIIDILSHSVSVPLRQIEIDLLQTPVLRRVYTEKKAIYFRKVPELIAALLPDVKQQYQARELLKQLNITDIATIPIDINDNGSTREYILAVLGPLDDEQNKFIKDVTNELMDHFNHS